MHLDLSDRHPGVTHLLSLFEHEHLPKHLQPVVVQFSDLAERMTLLLSDGPELTAGLRKLLEAKDCMVRQAVVDRR